MIMSIKLYRACVCGHEHMHESKITKVFLILEHYCKDSKSKSDATTYEELKSYG